MGSPTVTNPSAQVTAEAKHVDVEVHELAMLVEGIDVTR